jgi:hypothetical protein
MRQCPPARPQLLDGQRIVVARQRLKVHFGQWDARAAPTAAVFVEGGVAGDSEQPGGALGPHQLVPMAQGLEKGLLGQILGQLTAAAEALQVAQDRLTVLLVQAGHRPLRGLARLLHRAPPHRMRCSWR